MRILTKTLLIITGIWATWGIAIDAKGLPVTDQVVMTVIFSLCTIASAYCDQKEINARN